MKQGRKPAVWIVAAILLWLIANLVDRRTEVQIHSIGGRIDIEVAGTMLSAPIAIKRLTAVEIRAMDSIDPPGGGRITITGDGNVVGNGSRSTVIKQQMTDVTADEFLRLIAELRQVLPTAGLDSDTVQVIETDLQVVESQARKPRPNATLILLKLKSVAGLLATADGVWGIVERMQPLAQQAIEWAGRLF